MAEFQKVMRQFKRMCDKENCTRCPVGLARTPTYTCKIWIAQCPEKAEEVIMGWAAEHPEKTMKDVFFERFPNAVKRDNGRPGICLKWLGFTPIRADCSVDCADCWNQPAPEE